MKVRTMVVIAYILGFIAITLIDICLIWGGINAIDFIADDAARIQMLIGGAGLIFNILSIWLFKFWLKCWTFPDEEDEE